MKRDIQIAKTSAEEDNNFPEETLWVIIVEAKVRQDGFQVVPV